jgi:hypothetical protein
MKDLKLWQVLVVIVVIGIGIFAFWKYSERPSRSSTTYSPGEETLEYKLAAINAGYRIPFSHPSISKFRALLDNIQKKCRNGRRAIGDMTVFAHKRLKEKGNRITLLELMEKLDYSIPSEAIGANLDYAEISAAYLTLMGVK